MVSSPNSLFIVSLCGSLTVSQLLPTYPQSLTD